MRRAGAASGGSGGLRERRAAGAGAEGQARKAAGAEVGERGYGRRRRLRWSVAAAVEAERGGDGVRGVGEHLGEHRVSID